MYREIKKRLCKRWDGVWVGAAVMGGGLTTRLQPRPCGPPQRHGPPGWHRFYPQNRTDLARPKAVGYNPLLDSDLASGFITGYFYVWIVAALYNRASRRSYSSCDPIQNQIMVSASRMPSARYWMLMCAE